MSLRLDKGKYYVVVYYAEDGRRVQEYIGADERGAYSRLAEVLREAVKRHGQRLAEAEQHLKEMAVKS